MPKITAKIENIPTIEPRAEYSQGDILVSEDGTVWMVSEYERVVCIAISGRNTNRYSGEECDSSDPHELEELIGSYTINPQGLVVTLTIQ